MSYFVNAAPFENENHIEKKKMSKTLKKPIPKLPKLQLTSIEDEENNLADFRPPPQPVVSVKEGFNDDDEKEGFSNESNSDYASDYPQKYEEKPLSKMQQYKQFVSNIQNNIQPSNNNMLDDKCPEHYSSIDDGRKKNQSQLNEKIDYMIKMLEDQRTEKTEGVMEDVMLFSFIGIFTIFLVESFTKVGKYVR